MRIECVQNKITSLLQKIERVAGKNQNLPVLNCFLLQAEKGRLVVSATNLDLGVVGEVAVRVLKEGKVAIPVSVVTNFFSQLSGDGTVVLSEEGGVVEITTKHTKTTLKTVSFEDFPGIPHAEGVEMIFPAQEFIKGLQAVVYSSAVSSMKPELSSVCVYHDQKNLVFVATDSFRLAEKKISVKKIEDFHQILIPFKNVMDIIKLFEGYKGDLNFVSNKNQVSFSGGGFYVVSRLVEGTFPDYEQIIPKGQKTESIVLRQDLISALKMSTIFSNTFNQVSFKLLPSKKTFTIDTENDRVGRNSVALDAVVKGEEISINFNHRYLADCFQSINSDSVSLQFNGANKPLVMRGVGDQSFTYLVMPMNR